MNDKLIRDLEAYRLENKIAQEELADKLGVAFSTVNRWFNGKNKPSKIQFYHIEKLLRERTVNGKIKNITRRFVKNNGCII